MQNEFFQNLFDRFSKIKTTILKKKLSSRHLFRYSKFHVWLEWIKNQKNNSHISHEQFFISNV